jgi:hypothetical protein
VDIQTIEEEIRWIETALIDPNSVEHRIYLSNSPRKDLITRWAENLEKLHEAGKFTQEINTISTYIGSKFKSWGMDSAVHYVRHSLDFKYKNESQMRSEQEDDGGYDYREDSSNLLSFEAKQANQTLISFLTQTIEALKNNIERLKKDVILESKIPENELEEMYLNWNHILKRHQEAWDGREKVLSTHQHLMAFALSNYTINHAYTKYIKYARDDTSLTEKQASKIIRLQTNKVDQLFNPKNLQEAKELGFYGQQCNKCGSWRTEAKYHPDGAMMLYCYSIHEDKNKDQWGTLKTMKLEEIVL